MPNHDHSHRNAPYTIPDPTVLARIEALERKVESLERNAKAKDLELLKEPEAAAEIGLKPRHLREAVERCECAAFILEGKRYYKRADLRAFLKRRTKEAA